MTAVIIVRQFADQNYLVAFEVIQKNILQRVAARTYAASSDSAATADGIDQQEYLLVKNIYELYAFTRRDRCD